MAETIGHSKNHTFLIGKESTYGTAVSATKDIGLVQGFNDSPKKETSEIYASGSRLPQEIVSGLATLDFDMDVTFQNGRMYEYLLGSVAHALTSSDTKHTFSFAETLPSFTAESSFNLTTDQVYKYEGCVLTSGTTSIDTGGVLSARFSGRAEDVDTSSNSAGAAVISSLATLHYKHLILSTGAASSETDVGLLQSFSFTINNENSEVRDAGQVINAADLAGNMNMEMDFTIAFQTVAEYERFSGADTSIAASPTQFSMVINAHNGVALGSGRREFYAQLDGINYSEAGTAVSIGDKVIQTFRGKATALGSNGMYTVDNIASASWS